MLPACLPASMAFTSTKKATAAHPTQAVRVATSIPTMPSMERRTHPSITWGDLGNLEADASGHAHYERTVDFLQLAVDPKTIDGKAIIVHAGEDDLHSQPAGK